MAMFRSAVVGPRFLTTRTICPASDLVRMKSTSVMSEDVKKMWAKPFEEMPGPKGVYGIPYLGMALNLKPFGKHSIPKLNLLFDELVERHGPVIRLYTNEVTVFVTKAEDIATILRHEGKTPYRKPVPIVEVYYKRSGYASDISTLQGEEWSEVRKPLNRMMMRTTSLDKLVPAQTEIADDLVASMLNGNFNRMGAQNTLMAYSSENITHALFNDTMGFLKDPSEESWRLFKSVQILFEELHNSFYGTTLFYKWFETKEYKRFVTSYADLRRKANELVRKTKVEMAQRKRDGTYDPETATLVMNLLDDAALPEKHVIPSITSIYTAGWDSTAMTLQSLLQILATHPDKQDNLRHEVRTVLGENDLMTKKDLDNMPYLKAVVKESYRYRYPVILATTRKLPVDVVLGGYNVPAGTLVQVYPQPMLRKGFDNPEDFLPERWLRSGNDDSAMNEALKWAVFPFGYGPRTCIGKRLAEQEIYIALARAVQKVKIGLRPESEDTDFGYKLAIYPLKPLQFTFEKV